MKSKKVGLFFGSFNPIHVGHMILANYMLEYTEINELWFVVSPQNPFKTKKSLLDELHRYAIVQRTIEDEAKMKVSNIEFSLPQPSYTVDTLSHFEERYPSCEFSLILGEDNLLSFHKWKNFEVILERYKLFVYPRGEQPNGEPLPEQINLKGGNIELVSAPKIEISASFIRNAISEGKDVSWFLPEKAWNYIQEMNFYKTN